MARPSPLRDAKSGMDGWAARLRLRLVAVLARRVESPGALGRLNACEQRHVL